MAYISSPGPTKTNANNVLHLIASIYFYIYKLAHIEPLITANTSNPDNQKQFLTNCGGLSVGKPGSVCFTMQNIIATPPRLTETHWANYSSADFSE